MKALIFGDVHGNLPAMKKMLTHEQGNYDVMICHGDMVNYGPWSNECVELLNEKKDIVCLKGNHEDYFLSGRYPGHNIIAKTFFDFCHPKFNRQDIIRNYSLSYTIGDYVVRHTINDQYIFPDTDEIFIDHNYIIGHSHYQFMKKINEHSLVNTGSVGQNRKYINLIQYVIYDVDSNDILLKSLPYDHFVVINEMKAQNYPQICIEYYLNKKVYEL